MPCYLFTYHAHGSWLPDRARGYVRRGQGVLPADARMADRYRANLVQEVVSFDESVQRFILEEALVAGEHQLFRCHFLATDRTHVHALVSWSIDRPWEVVRSKLRESLTRRLNRELQRQHWFSKSPSRKRVKDRVHFDYLVGKYLPRHSGLKWCEGVGFLK